MDKLSSILYKETVQLGGKLQKMNEGSKEYKQTLTYLTKLMNVLVGLLKVHEPANIKEQQDVLMLMNRLKEIRDEQMASKDGQKTVEETIKFAKRRRKIKKLVD